MKRKFKLGRRHIFDAIIAVFLLCLLIAHAYPLGYSVALDITAMKIADGPNIEYLANYVTDLCSKDPDYPQTERCYAEELEIYMKHYFEFDEEKVKRIEQSTLPDVFVFYERILSLRNANNFAQRDEKGIIRGGVCYEKALIICSVLKKLNMTCLLTATKNDRAKHIYASTLVEIPHTTYKYLFDFGKGSSYFALTKEY